MGRCLLGGLTGAQSGAQGLVGGNDGGDAFAALNAVSDQIAGGDGLWQA